MASQPVYFATYVNTAGGGLDPPPHQDPDPGVQAANPPAPQHPGLTVDGSHPPPPTYAAHRAQPPTYTAHRAQPPTYTAHRAQPPTYAVHRAQNAAAADGNGGNSRDNENRKEASVVQSESRKWKWALFLVGNLITIAGIVYELAGLEVCFDEKLANDDGYTDDNTPEENAAGAQSNLWFLLIFGLWVDVFSAVSLSAIYRAPLDIKSAQKIPPEDTRNPQMTAIVNFLAPFSWSVLYLCGGYASQDFGKNLPCGGGAGGSGLATYLYVSGVLMVTFGFGMVILSAFMVKEACPCCCCCRPSANPNAIQAVREPPRCCGVGWSRKMLHKGILSKSKYFDLGWQLQGAVISYRVGALSLGAAILVGSLGGLGAVLAELGSFAPTQIREILEPVAL